MARQVKRLWTNNKLSEHIKIQVYSVLIQVYCVLNTLSYGSEPWTIHASQEHKLNIFHMRYLRRILDIKWQDRISIVLRRAGIPCMYSLLKQRRLRWLGHTVRMDHGWISRDLYGELAHGKRPTGRPLLRYKDICKRDMKTLTINTNKWETLA